MSDQKRSDGSSAIALILIIIIFAFVAYSFDFITCPNCNNNVLLRAFDEFCGYDGQVTIFQYVLYALAK